jgi:hypothetical protein
MPAIYGWTITRDHLAESYTPAEVEKYGSEVGVSGPHDITAEVEKKLATPGQRYVFRMYDDDGELYYTGFGAPATDDALGTEEFCFGPLDDFGMPNAGCTSIKWQGHPEWDCG